MVTAEWWERPEGVGDVQQRGTALSQGFSESQGGGTQLQGFKKWLQPFFGCALYTFEW